MGGLTRDGTVEPVSRGQIPRREWGQGKYHFSCSADHGKHWQPCPVDSCSSELADLTYCMYVCMYELCIYVCVYVFMYLFMYVYMYMIIT